MKKLIWLLLLGTALAQIQNPGFGSAPFFVYPTGSAGTNNPFTLNVVTFKAFYLPFSISATQIMVNISTADNTANLYDVGIFDSGGNMLAHVGATAGTTFANATGSKNFAWTGAITLNLPAGRYFIGYTTNCSATCATLGGGGGYPMPNTGTAGTTSGGALTSFTPPADSWTTAVMPLFALHN